MSFYSDASLVLIPSGYKDQKVYSAVPTDGSGDLSFTRASDATRVASNGLIEKVRTNVILQSNTFGTTWLPTNATITSGATAPDGTATAWTLANTAASGIIQQAATLDGLRSVSLYAKAGTHRYLYMGAYVGSGTDSYQVFDLQDGVITSGTKGRIESIGGGWYRCTSFGTDGTTGGVQIFPSNNSLGAGTTNGNILIWRCQYEAGDIATDYIATTSAAVSVGPVSGLPRLDYLNSTCPRLLLEPQRTNIITSSERFDVMTTSNLTVTANNATSPDGYTNADRLTPSGSGFHTIGNSISVTAGTPYTISFFYKNFDHKNIGFYDNNTSGSEISINVQDNTFTLGASVTAGGVISYGNGWYRAYATFSPSTTTMNNLIIFRDNTNNGNYTATGSYIWAYGWQVEAGAYATSYIPTLGTSVTRVGDSCYKSGISSLMPSTEGTFFVDSYIDFNANGTILASIRNSSSAGFNNTVYWYIISNKLEATLFNTPTFTGWSAQTATLTNGRYKVAIAWKANDFAFYLNGSLVASSTSFSAVPSGLDNIELANYAGSYPSDQEFNQVLLFKTRLSNSDLATLTTL
jgi:hypothetical protein